MQKYELVVMIDHTVKKNDREKIVLDFEAKLGKAMLKKDDIGIVQLEYDLRKNKWNDTAYVLSYYLELELDQLAMLKEEFQYNKFVLRTRLFKMRGDQEFMIFADLQKGLETIIEGRGKQRFGQKLAFFSNNANTKYLTWKSIPMLNKYMTRFGDIKPRKFTGNSVLKQKKVRKCILRAKELGFMAYIK